jgi:hypothetical protein
MVRNFAALALVFGLSASTLSAQTLVFTVNTAAANVHKSPSTGSLVIGHVQRGATLTVIRELGSWVKVPWPAAQDGTAYVHVSVGSISRPAAADAARVAAAPAAPQPPSATTAAVVVARPAEEQQRLPVTGTQYVRPPSHVVGIGGMMDGTPLGVGGTVRTWPHERIGIQFEGSRRTMTSAIAPGRATSFQFAPSVLVSLGNKMSDYVWLRPYVGAGVSFQRATLSDVVPGGPSVSDSNTGFRAFGGGELTFANAPQFSVSADVGYQRLPTLFTGFDTNHVGVAVMAHWYIR